MKGSQQDRSSDLYGLETRKRNSDISTPERKYFNSQLNNSNEVVRKSNPFGAFKTANKTIIARNSIDLRPSWMTKPTIEQNIGRKSMVSQASSKVTDRVDYNPGEKTITKEFETGHRRPLSSILSKNSMDEKNEGV